MKYPIKKTKTKTKTKTKQKTIFLTTVADAEIGNLSIIWRHFQGETSQWTDMWYKHFLKNIIIKLYHMLVKREQNSMVQTTQFLTKHK